MNTYNLSEMAKQILIAFEPDLRGGDPIFVIDPSGSTLWTHQDGDVRTFHKANAQEVRDALNELCNADLATTVNAEEYRITDKGIAAYQQVIASCCGSAGSS